MECYTNLEQLYNFKQTFEITQKELEDSSNTRKDSIEFDFDSIIEVVL
jgi:hypothetical protein